MERLTNHQFTVLIKVGGRLREFNYRQRSPQLFDGDTSDEYSRRYYFRIKQEGDGWQLESSSLPAEFMGERQAIIDAAVTRIKLPA